MIFRAHKFPYTDSLYYECNLKFCLKAAGECQRLPVVSSRCILRYSYFSASWKREKINKFAQSLQPPRCGKDGALSRMKRSVQKENTVKSAEIKSVAVVRSITVREPGMAEALVTANPGTS